MDFKKEKHEKRRERQRDKARWKKLATPRLSIRNGYGVTDLTPFNAVQIMRGKPEDTKL